MRTVQLHAEPIIDETGAPVRVVGVIRDVTDTSGASTRSSSASAGLIASAHELQRLTDNDAPSDLTPLRAQ